MFRDFWLPATKVISMMACVGRVLRVVQQAPHRKFRLRQAVYLVLVVVFASSYVPT